METIDLNRFEAKAKILAAFTIGYNLIEGIISVVFGLEDNSISLLGFGVDSFLEVGSAIVVLWRFQRETSGSNGSINRERFAIKIIGALLLLLSLGTLFFSIRNLIYVEGPSTTLPGIIVSLVSLSFMFFLWKAKVGVATALQSATLRADAYCSISCIYLSGLLFFGSILFRISPSLWWVDSVGAIFISLLIAKEGWERVRGDECCENKC